VTEFKWEGDKAIKAIEGAINKALIKSALLVEGEAKNLAPVDTGNLRNSLTHEVEGQEAYVGTPVSYAIFQELGTSKMAAQPFLNPALESNKENILKIFKEEISKDIDD